MAVKTFYGVGGVTNCSPGSFCSGRTVSTAFANGGGRIQSSNEIGPAANFNCGIAPGETTVAEQMIEMSPGATDYAAGIYAAEIAVGTANMNVTLDELYLCRVDSSCGAIQTIGSLTGIGRSLGSTGAVTHNITGAVSSGTSTDRLILVSVCSNSSSMSTQTWTMGVTVTTPDMSSGGGGTPFDLGTGTLRL